MDNAELAVKFSQFLDALEDTCGEDADIRTVFIGVEVDRGDSLTMLPWCNEDRRYVIHAFLDELHDAIGYPEHVEED